MEAACSFKMFISYKNTQCHFDPKNAVPCISEMLSMYKTVSSHDPEDCKLNSHYESLKTCIMTIHTVEILWISTQKKLFGRNMEKIEQGAPKFLLISKYYCSDQLSCMRRARCIAYMSEKRNGYKLTRNSEGKRPPCRFGYR
jgi:hypothetical protein